ncbi:MAG: ribosome rescue GTPase HflX [Gammaproteobacteria bacterium]
MFERPRSGESAILVHIDLPGLSDRDDLLEFTDLVRSAGVKPVDTITGSRPAPDAKYFIGRGKADEISARLKAVEADVVLFNHALSPSQERNLEKLFECRVLDRNGLILDIFAQRARSFEGKLQVELAQLQHLSTRLVRGWTHLERQKGGIGLRGPGETQLETDRRLLAVRIKHIHQRLEKVRKQREQGRRSRVRAEVPTISLVGYTNAGKSTLFNYLCGATVYAADQLFATLDPTLRRLDLPGVGAVVLADTVGFVRNLPHELVAAFRSTLEETIQADLLIHVIDAHDEDRQLRVEQVNEVLQSIGADSVKQLLVYNKIDLSGESAAVKTDADGQQRIWCSAISGEGINELVEAIGQVFQPDRAVGWLNIPSANGRLRARIYQLGEVTDDRPDIDGGWWMSVQIGRQELDRILDSEGIVCPLFEHPDQSLLAGKQSGQ